MTLKISTQPKVLETSSRCWVSLERLNGTRWLDQCDLSGTAKEKLEKLRVWHHRRLGISQRALAYLLCRRWNVAIGTVSAVSLPYYSLARLC